MNEVRSVSVDREDGGSSGGLRGSIAVLAMIFLMGCGSSEIGPVSIAIQPFNGADPEDVEAVKDGIADRYNASVVVLAEKPLPAAAFYAERNRHRADALLEFLDAISTHTKVLGLVAGDISTTKGLVRDWGIFGLASIGGHPCVISGFRLQRDRVSRSRYLERLQKVANHELGHTFNLSHCSTSGCLMQDADGKVATFDSSDGRFCAKCDAALRARSLLRVGR